MSSSRACQRLGEKPSRRASNEFVASVSAPWREARSQSLQWARRGNVRALRRFFVPISFIGKHTFGEGVRFHPHLHALATSGGWDQSRSWHPVSTWDQGVLRELFEIEVFRFLRKRELLSRERMELILSWPHSGFNVHVGEAVAPDDKISLARVARYMLRASVVMSRISYDRTRATVRIDPHGPHSEGPIELDVLDFIARLSVHIPEPHERLVLYYGLYSNAFGQSRVSGSRHVYRGFWAENGH